MRNLMRTWGCALAMVGACFLFTDPAWAAGGDTPDGAPPFPVEGGAKGTRVSGAFVIEFVNTPTGDNAIDGVRGVLRLRSKKQLGGFFASLPGPVPYGQGSEQAAIAAALLGQLAQQVVDEFFPGDTACSPSVTTNCRAVGIYSIDEFQQVDDLANLNQYFVMDVQLAVN